jgi:hypothetical protein
LAASMRPNFAIVCACVCSYARAPLSTTERVGVV